LLCRNPSLNCWRNDTVKRWKLSNFLSEFRQQIKKTGPSSEQNTCKTSAIKKINSFCGRKLTVFFEQIEDFQQKIWNLQSLSHAVNRHFTPKILRFIESIIISTTTTLWSKRLCDCNFPQSAPKEKTTTFNNFFKLQKCLPLEFLKSLKFSTRRNTMHVN